MDKHISIGEAIRDHLLAETRDPQSLSEMEDKIRRILWWLGNVVLHLWLRWLAREASGRVVKCRCGGEAQYVRRRPG